MRVAALRVTEANTVAVGGPMVPRHAFPPGIERSDRPHFRTGDGGPIDTGYPCRHDIVRDTLTVTGPPAGIMTSGGYRFAQHALSETIAGIAAGATLTARPDRLLGGRLVGTANDRAAAAVALVELGVNPLVVKAFSDPIAAADDAPDPDASDPDASDNGEAETRAVA
jgi:hypothetical protein